MTRHELSMEICGKKEGRLILLASRTGMGKSSVAMGMALDLAAEGKRVNFLSCTEKREYMNQHMEFILHAKPSEIQKQNITVTDPAAFTVDDIRKLCENKADAVFIDSLQDMNKEEHSIEDLQKALKLLAEELDCPIVVLSNLTQKIDTRFNHEPRIKDLAETNLDANLYDEIMLFYRLSKYKPNAPNDQCVIVFKDRKEKCSWYETINCII